MRIALDGKYKFEHFEIIIHEKRPTNRYEIRELSYFEGQIVTSTNKR